MMTAGAPAGECGDASTARRLSFTEDQNNGTVLCLADVGGGPWPGAHRRGIQKRLPEQMRDQFRTSSGGLYYTFVYRNTDDELISQVMVSKDTCSTLK